MAFQDRLAAFLASDSKDASSVTMDELLVKVEDMTLADHDKIHHYPNGYKDGDECKLREDFKAANAGEELDVPNGTSSYGVTKTQNPSVPKSGNDIDKSSDLEYVNTTPKKFCDVFRVACESYLSTPSTKKDIWRVAKGYSISDYEHTSALLQTENGDCAAVKKNGDIVSVCMNVNPKRKGVGSKMLQDAVRNGGDRLDAYSGIFQFYTNNGFVPVSWCEWNDEYAPSDWKEEYGREPVVFFKYVGEGSFDKAKTFEEWSKDVKASRDYDEAQKARDNEIDKRQSSS